MADFDVGIIGGGPAGSSLASYLALAGVKCVVIESEVFPRPHVGESLVPSSTRVFNDIGFLPKMESAGFPKKYGAAWTTGSQSPLHSHDWKGLSDELADVQFIERPQPGVDLEYTYHVDRSKFDLLLIQHAQELGARVYQGMRVVGVNFDSQNPVISTESKNGKGAIQVKIVVDASGRRTLLGNQLGLKKLDPVFDQFAVHTWFKGFDRSEGRSERFSDYIFIHFLPISNSWVWQIPIDEETTSIGVVTQKKNFLKTKAGREDFFWKSVATQPKLASKLRSAVQLKPLVEEGDYSYAMREIVGDRFLLIGDAARFVDPIFSTGVSIALNSARFASQDIIQALKTGDFSKSSFKTYSETIWRGTNNWYEFITVYYRLNVLFSWFVNDKEHRLDILKLLQGDVYDEEQPAVLRKMKETVSKIENDVHHPWHALLNDLTAGAFKPP